MGWFDYFSSSLKRAYFTAMNPALLPTPYAYSDVYDKLFEKYPEIEIHTPDGFTLSGIWMGDQTAKKIVLYCPTMGASYEMIQTSPEGHTYKIAVKLQEYFPDRAIVMVNVRGVGRSTGFPDQMLDFKKDMDAATAYLRTHRRVEHIIAWGHSLGTMFAIQSDAEKIVLDRPFISPGAVITQWTGIEKIERFIKTSGLDFDMIAKVNEIDPERLRIIYSMEDTTIPPVASLGYHFREKAFSICMDRRDEAPHVDAINQHEFSRLELN